MLDPVVQVGERLENAPRVRPLGIDCGMTGPGQLLAKICSESAASVADDNGL
jgi:hypothetical protein